MAQVELVVACYQDDLFWIHDISPNVTVYYKDPEHPNYDPKFALPNVGREAHTWIHHIIERYETLSPYTLFLQGNPLDHCSPKEIYALAQNGIVDEFQAIGITSVVDKMGRPLNNWNCDLEYMWNKMFLSSLPDRIVCKRGAQFIATDILIKQRSLDFWKRLYAICEEWKDCAHALECLWSLVLDPRFKDVTQ